MNSKEFDQEIQKEADEFDNSFEQPNEEELIELSNSTEELVNIILDSQIDLDEQIQKYIQQKKKLIDLEKRFKDSQDQYRKYHLLLNETNNDISEYITEWIQKTIILDQSTSKKFAHKKKRLTRKAFKNLDDFNKFSLLMLLINKFGPEKCDVDFLVENADSKELDIEDFLDMDKKTYFKLIIEKRVQYLKKENDSYKEGVTVLIIIKHILLPIISELSKSVIDVDSHLTKIQELHNKLISVEKRARKLKKQKEEDLLEQYTSPVSSTPRLAKPIEERLVVRLLREYPDIAAVIDLKSDTETKLKAVASWIKLHQELFEDFKKEFPGRISINFLKSNPQNFVDALDRTREYEEIRHEILNPISKEEKRKIEKIYGRKLKNLSENPSPRVGAGAQIVSKFIRALVQLKKDKGTDETAQECFRELGIKKF